MKCALALSHTLSPAARVCVCVCVSVWGADIIKPTTARILLRVCLCVCESLSVCVVVVGYENHFSKCTFYVWAEQSRAEREGERERRPR